MDWVIIHLGPPPLYIKTDAGLTFREDEAQRFADEMSAVKKLLELKLPRDWFVIEVRKELHRVANRT